MRFTVKAALTTVMAAVITLMLAGAWVSVSSMRHIRADAADISDNWLPSVRLLGEVKYAMTRYRVGAARVAMAGNAEETRAAKTLFATLDDGLRTAMQNYEKLLVSEEDRQAWQAYKVAWAAYMAESNRIVALSEAGQYQAAGQAYLKAIDPFNAALKVVEDDVAFHDKGARIAVEDQAALVDSSIFWISIASAAGVLIALAAAAYVSLRVSTPLQQLTGSMQAVAGGELSSKIPSADRRDEIGDMARALAVFRDSLAENERLKAMQTEKDAEMARQLLAERHRIADDFMASMGQLAESFVTASGEVSDAARGLSATAEETSRQASAVAEAAERASSSVGTVASSSEEMASSVQEIGSQVQRSASIAETAATEAKSTETNIRALSQAVDGIGEVLGLIRNIAGQTNLLALNATIEAARAGEAGKGFAVVAAEVKQLANQTARATDDIERRVQDIQGATGSTVSSIDHIVSTISEIRTSSGVIAETVRQQGMATHEIAASAQAAAHGAH